MSNPERLFRDAEGAALERVARLEDENRRLRAEVERLAAGRTEPEGSGPPPVRVRPTPPHPLPGRFFVLAMALPLAMISLLLAVGPRHHARSYPPPRYGEAIAPRSFETVPYGARPTPVLEVRPVSTETPCSPPFRYDANGHRHYKLECLR